MTDPKAEFERLLAELRPRLHRYCARMTGSVIDGEDVLQETLVKAIEAFPHTGPLANVEGWLFRIAHNAALDFLRRRARREGVQDGDEALETIADPDSEIERRQAAAASLRTLMRLPVAQRSSVILMDVLGHSLEEISEVLESTVPAVKANLHRGRQRLVELAAEPDDRPPPVLAEADRQRLAAYVARFNARDFDALRAQLADDVKVEVVNRTRLSGRGEVGRYFGNYSQTDDWHLVPGLVEGRPAVVVLDPDPAGGPAALLHADRLAGWPAAERPGFPLCALRRGWSRAQLQRFVMMPWPDRPVHNRRCYRSVHEGGTTMHKLMTRTAVAALAAVALFSLAPAAFAQAVMYKADLTGAAQVPPNTTKGTGALKATYDPASKKLTYTVTYKDLSGPATAAHFHGPGRRRCQCRRRRAGRRPAHQPDQGRGHPDRCPGGRPRRRPLVLQRPHRSQPARRDPRPGDEGHVDRIVELGWSSRPRRTRRASRSSACRR